MKTSRYSLHVAGLTAWLLMGSGVAGGEREAQRIQPWAEDPRYWQYQGEPVILIGASNADNLFNHPQIGSNGLETHLDDIRRAGGNYVRNTMSGRDEGNLWPFARDEETGLYDLRELNEAYWERFRNFLEWTAERGIIVQIELWDRFDYARNPWQDNPFNPKNNVNYTAGESGLLEVIDTHPSQRENAFFRSIPELQNNELILPHQKAHTRRMMEISLDYEHVLYCISNETNDTEAWSRYWAEFLREIADENGRGIEVTEMWDAWNLRDDTHARTFDHPDLYTFVDVSQNTHQIGQSQWDNLQWARQRVAHPPRPVNNVKMYGGSHGGGAEEGQHKLWRNILGGAASARYHRPGGGIGLNEVTAAHLGSMRQVLQKVDLITAQPDLGLMRNRYDDEAYLATIPGEAYVLYFPRNGAVELNLESLEGTAELRWLDVLNMEWSESSTQVDGGGWLELASPPKEQAWTVRAEKAQVVFTRDADGEARLYLNGREAAADQIGGEFSDWDTGMHLALGNELVGDRAWLGTYHDVALYDRAFEFQEVAKHYEAGEPGNSAGLQARYRFDEGAGAVVRDVSGIEPALDLYTKDAGALSWSAEGLELKNPGLISTHVPAERLTRALQASNALTVEVWLTPSQEVQNGPARIVTLSSDYQNRNFTLGYGGNSFQMRLRTTETSDNGLPGLDTEPSADRPWVAVLLTK